MEFLGIGPEELIFILVILFLILGPKDLVKLGSTLGKTIRNIRESGAWRSINDATRQLRELPDNLARQAGIDDLKAMGKEISGELKRDKEKLQELDQQFTAWTREPDPRSQKKTPPAAPETTEEKK